MAKARQTSPPARKRPAAVVQSKPPAAAAAGRSSAQPWTFLTNHAHVLLCIAADSTARIRDVAERVGITERAVQRIIAELEEAGYLMHERDGRRNVYRISTHLPLRHPVERHRSVGALVELVQGPRAVER